VVFYIKPNRETVARLRGFVIFNHCYGIERARCTTRATGNVDFQDARKPASSTAFRAVANYGMIDGMSLECPLRAR
jgi:hypothetical protein